MTISSKNVEILGTKSTGKIFDDENVKVFLYKEDRYTGTLIFDPHFEEYQLRDCRKNKKAYVLRYTENQELIRL